MPAEVISFLDAKRKKESKHIAAVIRTLPGADNRAGAREAYWGHEREDRFDGVRVADTQPDPSKLYLTIVTSGDTSTTIPPLPSR